MRMKIRFSSMVIVTTMCVSLAASAETWGQKAQWCWDNPQKCFKDNWEKAVVTTSGMVLAGVIGRKLQAAKAAKAAEAAKTAEGKDPNGQNGDHQEDNNDQEKQPKQDNNKKSDDGNDDDDEQQNQPPGPRGEGSPYHAPVGADSAMIVAGGLNSANTALEQRAAAASAAAASSGGDADGLEDDENAPEDQEGGETNKIAAAGAKEKQDFKNQKQGKKKNKK